jgi:hypothetical protein
MVLSELRQSRARTPFKAGNSLDPTEFAQVRRTCLIEHCKWDPQVGGQATLAPFPVFISEADWTEVADSALALALETLAAERELLQRTDLHRLLGLPGTLCRAFARATVQKILPVRFAPRPDLGVPYDSVVVLLSPAEWEEVRAGRLPLPPEWGSAADLKKIA